MGRDLRLRAGTPADYPALGRLDSSFSTEWVLFVERRGGPVEHTVEFKWRKVKPAGATRRLEWDGPLEEEAKRCDRFIVGEEGGEAAGYLTLAERWNRTAEITAIVVDAARRRRGLGRLFVAEAERFARERGLRAVQWEAQSDNRSAIEFAASRGFRIVGSNEAFYRNDDLGRQAAADFRGLALFLVKETA